MKYYTPKQLAETKLGTPNFFANCKPEFKQEVIKHYM